MSKRGPSSLSSRTAKTARDHAYAVCSAQAKQRDHSACARPFACTQDDGALKRADS
jgi:hypothetical protein